MWHDLRFEFLEFLALGGQTMWPLFLVTCLMWTLIIERFLYFWFVHPRAVRQCQARWHTRTDHTSWSAERIREMWISELSLKASAGVDLIATCVAVCPLFGLLGTVLGMLEVFHVIAVAGGGNIRAMAAGVSAAIVSTMAGMVAALSGLLFSYRLSRRAETARRTLGDLLAVVEEERP